MTLPSTSGRVDPWPVVNEADLVIPEKPNLRFVVVTDGHRCSVHALLDLIAIGSLRWLIADPERDDDSGEIMHIEVTERFRRQGVGTALLKAATAYAQHYDLPRPRHSDSRTPLGDAWATSLGAAPAKDIMDA